MKIIVVAGARPNFMKIGPIMSALRARRQTHPEISMMLVHTGQHYDAQMSDNFFTDLKIPPPDINLGIGSGSHAQQTGRVMIAFEEVCLRERPDCVVVVGDVNSTMACAITAKKLNLRVAHVEAGLRSGDMTMPEEINRLCTDVIADLLFTTDSLAGENLTREGVGAEKIHMVGNTMIDTLLQHLPAALATPRPAESQFAVLTLHRPSNVDSRDTLGGILGAICTIAQKIPVVFPAHPRTRKNIAEFGLDSQIENSGIRVIDPLSYLPFLGLVARSRMVLTDSGGIQEETTVLGIPCLTMRLNTERPITCELGTNVLVGVDPARIREEAMAVLDGRTKPHQVPEKWDGHAAERIVDVLLRTA